MNLIDLLKNNKIKEIEEIMGKLTGNYQVYDPTKLPIVPQKNSLVHKKMLDLNYKREDFLDKSVSDLGCCLGFFSWLSLNLGASRVIGYDNNPDFINLNNTIYNHSTQSFPQYIDKIKFEEKNLTSLPELDKTDIILVHAIIHWFFIMDEKLQMREVLSWLHDNCNYAVYLEGCVDADDPTMKRYNISSVRCNRDLFLKEAKEIFSKVELIGDMSYCPTRIMARLYK